MRKASDTTLMILLCMFIAFSFYGCDLVNRSSVRKVAQQVIVRDKYHKAEDCSYMDSVEYCDPERFVVLFDNNESIDLKKSNWQTVHEGQTWHFHKETGRLGIEINRSAYAVTRDS